MTRSLEADLLSIEAEAVGEHVSHDLFDDTVGDRAFGRFAANVLAVYQRHFPGISAGWVSVAGLEPGFLQPIAAQPEHLRGRIPKLGKKQAHELAPHWVEDVPSPTSHEYLTNAVPSPSQVMVLRLMGHDEYYGVIILCTESKGYLGGDTLAAIKDSLPLLNRLMAEANFSMRLQRLAAPFEFPGGLVTKELMYRQIVRQACLGFAADGAVVRFRKASDAVPDGYALEVVDREGLVSDAQVAQSGAGHRICLEVLNSPSGMTVQSMRPDGARISVGTNITDGDDADLRKHGVQAYMIMKLQSDLAEDHPSGMGTLSIFHRMPQVFSRRDINLFRGFCERVADDVALLDQRDANEAISRFLQAQNALGTRSEIIALLGHDFGHRVFHVKDGLETFVETCRRNWRDRKLPDNVRTDAEALEKTCTELADIVRQIRQLGQGPGEDATTFEVATLFQDIKQQLALVFERNHMALEYRVEGHCTLHGLRGILLQALFNLVVNSVDAQRQSGRRKLNTVHLTCREFGTGARRRLDFNVWDEGPGISRAVFPDPQQVFEVGKTSKPLGQGTGIGLPAARNLLGRYFHANLQLTDRNKALFQFSVPAPLGSK